MVLEPKKYILNLKYRSMEKYGKRPKEVFFFEKKYHCSSCVCMTHEQVDDKRKIKEYV